MRRILFLVRVTPYGAVVLTELGTDWLSGMTWELWGAKDAGKIHPRERRR